MDAAHREAWQILTRNRDVLEELATQLLEKETLLEKDLERIFAPVVKQPERPLWSSDDTLVMDEAIAAGDYFAGSKVPRRGGAGGEKCRQYLSDGETIGKQKAKKKASSQKTRTG